jgi:hypothetical protein
MTTRLPDIVLRPQPGCDHPSGSGVAYLDRARDRLMLLCVKSPDLSGFHLYASPSGAAGATLFPDPLSGLETRTRERAANIVAMAIAITIASHVPAVLDPTIPSLPAKSCGAPSRRLSPQTAVQRSVGASRRSRCGRLQSTPTRC